MIALRAVSVRLMAGCVLALLGACGSKTESTDSGEPVAAPAPAPVSTATTASAKAEDILGEWDEVAPASVAPPTTSSATPADPDAVIERYKRDCPEEAKTAECRALRADVEAIFLGALVAVRATEAIVDPEWYRLAAVSESPQLACIGLNELIWFPQRTAEDEAAIVHAIDSPYRSVRGAVMLSAQKFPSLAGAMKRSAGIDYGALTGVCVDSVRDPVPDTKWAGGYVGAQYRPFASTASLRWFTTPDPPEKVTSWFAARGKPARTAEELAADSQARWMEEMTRLSSNPDEDNTQEMMNLMASQGLATQWIAHFRDLQGIGEVKFVMISAHQAVAIFRDDLLDATSIVAPRPVKPASMTPDLEAAKEEAEMRSIFGY